VHFLIRFKLYRFRLCDRKSNPALTADGHVTNNGGDNRSHDEVRVVLDSPGQLQESKQGWPKISSGEASRKSECDTAMESTDGGLPSKEYHNAVPQWFIIKLS